jgi:hypothetical protein
MKNMSSDEKTEFYKRLSQIENRVDRVLFILESDSRTNTQGLVEEVRTLREKVSELQIDKKVRNAQIATWGAVGSMAVLALSFLFKQLIVYIFR